MTLRFDGSRGAFRLLQWNVRELALTASLGLRSLRQRAASRNHLKAARTGSGLSRVSAPAPAKAAHSAHVQGSVTSRPWHFNRRRISSIATVMVALVAGYAAGRATAWQEGPISTASADVAMAPSPAPESSAPLAWVSPVDAVQEPSPPVAETGTLNVAPAPVSGPRPLSADEVREAQAWLNAFGFSSGSVDGLVGPQTVAAVKRYRIARNMDEEGGLDQSVLKQLRQQSGH